MKIALIGYGKMGQLIEEIARQREHTIVAKGSSDWIHVEHQRKSHWRMQMYA